MENEPKKISLVERLKNQTLNQKKYAEDKPSQIAQLDTQECQNCGAGRAKQKGVTNCAYCGFSFIEVKLIDGINIKSTDNSK